MRRLCRLDKIQSTALAWLRRKMTNCTRDTFEKHCDFSADLEGKKAQPDMAENMNGNQDEPEV